MARGGFPGGFGGGNINNLMKQAQKLQKDMEQAQKELEAKEFEASVGGGAVVVKVNGKKEVLAINIKEEVVDDLETIEQEINSENPKYVKIRKAWYGIKSFISKIPKGVKKATIIATQCWELYEKLKPFIEK